MEHMDYKELKQTEIWDLYEQARNYCRTINMFSETDLNYRMYNDDQWNGVKLKGFEPVQLNFIKPIVRYKVGVLHANLYQINYSSQNFENKEFRENAEKICDMLNKKADRVWEKDAMDNKTRVLSNDAAVNSEGIVYVTYNTKDKEIANEILNKNDVFYGNENDSDIQRQPYILIKQRLPIIEAIDMAKAEGVSDEKLQYIIGDNDTFETAGDSGKLEKDLMCTIVTKMYKENGTVHYSKATRWVELKKDTDSGLSLYPVAHFIWEEKKGSARGQGEVKWLIPNQIETNKNFLRSIVVAKNTAYPQRVANVGKIVNPSAIGEVGSIIKTNSNSVDDVSKILTTLQPAQMSTDVEKLRNELISITRELANASEIATGGINPEDASGRAILAVQNASKQPLTEQLESFKACIEDLARIWLDNWTVYSPDGIKLEEDRIDEMTGEETTELITVPQSALEELKATVKVDITPKSAFDKYAQELSIENLLKEGFFNPQRLGELKIYCELLDDDSTMPKQKILEAVQKQEEEQMKIAQMNADMEMMFQRANQFINSDPDSQASQMADVANQMQMENNQAAE